MAHRLAGYQPRAADHGVLYRVIDEHLEPFLDAAAHHADGHRLPKFVEQEFRDFLTCGVLAHGFARLRCGDCAFERLVPFSCKGRGFCPSCGGRRMTECAARLVDGILPHVPVRQWVLSLPHRLRYLLAWDHTLCRAVLAVYARVLLSFQRRRARRRGLRGGHSGSVTVIQRFGGGLNLNVHFHTLVLAGVFTEGEGGTLHFRPLPPPTDDEVGVVLATIYTRVCRLLRRRGFDASAADLSRPDPVAEASPMLAGISSASIQGRIALGPRAGARGEVDQKYLDDSGDTSVRLKQALREEPDTIFRLTGLILRMARNLHEGFHELFPPTEKPIAMHREQQAHMARSRQSR